MHTPLHKRTPSWSKKKKKIKVPEQQGRREWQRGQRKQLPREQLSLKSLLMPVSGPSFLVLPLLQMPLLFFLIKSNTFWCCVSVSSEAISFATCSVCFIKKRIIQYHTKKITTKMMLWQSGPSQRWVFSFPASRSCFDIHFETTVSISTPFYHFLQKGKGLLSLSKTENRFQKCWFDSWDQIRWVPTILREGLEL